MPGPRNPKRQKKLNALKEKKRKESPLCKVEVVPIATPEVDTSPPSPTPQVEKDGVVTVEQGAELDELEQMLLREPPVYDPGTGPRVKSMDEFLRSSFASEPTWDDELCAEFAQEEMVEMLRSVLPDEMALVSTQHYGAIGLELKWAVMKVRVVQQEPTTFARVPGVLEDIPDGGYFDEPAAGTGVAPDSAQGIPGIDGRAGDQRTLYALSIHLHLAAFVLDRFHRLNRLLRPRIPQLSRGDRPHLWADRGRNGGGHLAISLRGGRRRAG